MVSYEEIRLEHLKEDIDKCYELIHMRDDEFVKMMNEKNGKEWLTLEYAHYAKWGAIQAYIEHMKVVAYIDYDRKEEQ